jgi:hypothetical protein
LKAVSYQKEKFLKNNVSPPPKFGFGRYTLAKQQQLSCIAGLAFLQKRSGS